jgi:triacylglycerol lipase
MRLINTVRCAFPVLLALFGEAYGQTSSPFPPPLEDVGHYVVNGGAGLDTGCTYRSAGPLIIRFTIPATMNPNQLNPDGTLKDPQLLIDNGVIAKEAKISFPVFDIDDKAVTSGFAPERDTVSFNGQPVVESGSVKVLSGFNNTWVNDSFRIDIGRLKFAAATSNFAQNELRIDIDTANAGPGGGEYWCMAVDWVATEFDAAYPYVLSHGINANKDTWLESDSPGVLTRMEQSGVLYKALSTAKPNGSVAGNAVDLKAQIHAFLTTVKAKKVNIIAHSKGGLDSQALATLSMPEFEVLSLGTLSTPHRGSVVADLTLLQRRMADFATNVSQDPNGYAQKFVTSKLAGGVSNGIWPGWGGGPQPPGLNDLTTQAATAAIDAGIRGNVISHVFTVGADAGPNCARDQELTNAQIDPMNPSLPLVGRLSYVYNTLRLAYRSICSYSSAAHVDTDYYLIPTGTGIHVITAMKYETTPGAAHPNDIVVGTRSANPGWGMPLGDNANTNHSTVKNGANVQKILDLTTGLR